MKDEDKCELKFRVSQAHGVDTELIRLFIALHPSLVLHEENEWLWKVYQRVDDKSMEHCLRTHGSPADKKDDNGEKLYKQLHYMELQDGVPSFGTSLIVCDEDGHGNLGLPLEHFVMHKECVSWSSFVNFMQKLYAPGEVDWKTYGGHGKTRAAEYSSRVDRLSDVKGDEFTETWQTWSTKVEWTVSLDETDFDKERRIKSLFEKWSQT